LKLCILSQKPKSTNSPEKSTKVDGPKKSTSSDGSNNSFDNMTTYELDNYIHKNNVICDKSFNKKEQLIKCILDDQKIFTSVDTMKEFMKVHLIHHEDTDDISKLKARINIYKRYAKRGMNDKAIKRIMDPNKLQNKKVVQKLPVNNSEMKSKKYILKTFKPINLVNISFDKVGTKPKKNLFITVEQLLHEINNDTFMNKYFISVKKLIEYKINIYSEIYNKTIEERSQDERMMKSMGMDPDSILNMQKIETLFPNYNFNNKFSQEVLDLIDYLKKYQTDITLEKLRQNITEAINDTDNGIESIIGNKIVKDQIASQLYSFSEGLKVFLKSFNNISIYGSAGVGKTRLAKIFAFVFSKSGILARNLVKVVTSADLIGHYVGTTAPKTKSVLMSTLDGIVFIDEAYQIMPCKLNANGENIADAGKSFGPEAITEIVNFLDKYIGLNIVIIAGYEREMRKCFMSANEGLARRFPVEIILKSYSNEELTNILIKNLIDTLPDNYNIADDDTSNFLFSIIQKLSIDQPSSLKNQAGDMLNLSSSIIKSILGAYVVKWKNNDLENNIPIILQGVDNFLSVKGLTVNF